MISLEKFLYIPKEYNISNLSKSVVFFAHARADISLSASIAMVAFLNICQPKSHSSAPPEASALQYTVDLKLGWILEKKNLN